MHRWTSRVHAAYAAMAILGLCMGVQVAGAEESLTAREIMERNYSQMAASDGSFLVKMRIIDKSGGEIQRTVRRETLRANGQDEWSMIRFVEPADVAGTGLLSIEKSGSADDIFLYLPALRKSRRISGSNNGDYFMGSDFTYKDLRNEKLDENEYERLEDQEYDGRLCAQIVANPTTEREREEGGYSSRKLWVDQATWLVLKQEFYGQHGELLKTLEARDVRKVSDAGAPDGGRFRPFYVVMENFDRQRRTELVFEKVELGVGMEESKFSKRSLERGI